MAPLGGKLPLAGSPRAPLTSSTVTSLFGMVIAGGIPRPSQADRPSIFARRLALRCHAAQGDDRGI